MSEKADKIWERPWTKQEFIDNADNWSLAGDVALLNTLKSFSDTLLTKANEVNNSLNNLTKNLDNTALRLSIAQNEFQSLRNNQFIESRVYEEDETLPATDEEKTGNANDNNEEEAKLNQMKDAVFKGLKVLDKYFDKVEVNVSDTEDEADDYTSYVLKPKDMYIDRPLPYVIGTEEWHKKWHVGLVDSSSESEIEDIVDKFSDTDSESDLPAPDRSQIKATGTSDTSSEIDFSHKTSSGRPVANSTFSDARQDTLGSSDSDQSSLPVQTPISSDKFAEQLAAKLGNVISQKTDVAEPEVNTRPIQKTTETNRFPGLFFDEPPPLDEDDDIFHKTAQKGLFSGGDNLFDDEDEKDSLWESNNEGTPKVDGAIKKSADDIFDNEGDDDLFSNSANKTKSVDLASSKKIQTKSLFDDDESSDDDIFKTAKVSENKPSYLKPASKTTYPLYDDEPPALEVDQKETPVSTSPKKKPPGGIFLPGANDIFANQKLGSKLQSRRKDSENTDQDAGESISHTQSPLKIVNDSQGKTNTTKEENRESKKPDNASIKEVNPPESKTEKKVSLFDELDASPGKGSAEANQSKKFSLFDEVDDLFKDDLFSAASTKKFTSSLFDDDLVEDDLFSPGIGSQAAAKDSLFNDDNNSKVRNETETKSVNENIKPEVSPKPLFSNDIKESLDKAESSIDDLLPSYKNPISEGNDKNMEEHGKPKESATASPGEDTDQLNATGKVKSLFEDDYDDDDIFDNSKLASHIKPKFSLFDDVPVIDHDGDLFMSKNIKKSATTKHSAQSDLFSDTSEIKPKESSYTESKKQEEDSSDVVSREKHVEASKESESPKAKEFITEEASNVQINRPTHLSLVSDLENDVSDVNKARLEEVNKTPSGVPLPVNIFSSSPPPEDDNWDSKSDYNDPFFDGFETNERSGLFDGPLSLPSYDSSGIGHETTRIDTDVSSSFDPYASSSRRLSTDIYNEQQSADSFFVTKNRTEPFSLDAIDENDHLNQNVSPNAESILQAGDSSLNKTSSVFEITPSGDSAHLLHDADSTLDCQSSKSKQPAPDECTEKPGTHREMKNDGEEVGKPRLSIVDQLHNESVGNSENLNDVSETEEGKGKQVTSWLEKLENSKSIQESDKVKTPGFPGKLKHNLNINVNALMPGSLPPRKTELPKSRSLESASVDESDFIPPLSASAQQLSDVAHTRKLTLERSSSFENKPNEVEVLQSITKDRARVPLGRKPSTRRGRREIQKVTSVEPDRTEKHSETQQTKTECNVPDSDTGTGDSLLSSKESTSLFGSNDSDDADDLFSSISSTRQANAQPRATSKVTTELKSRESGGKTEAVIPTKAEFGAKPKEIQNVSQEKSSSKTADIFGSDDDSDDIFSTKGTKVLQTKPAKKELVKKPLFSDDEDDDDLFGSSNSTKTKIKTDQKRIVPQKPRTATVKKLQNIETDDDPLSSLLK